MERVSLSAPDLRIAGETGAAIGISSFSNTTMATMKSCRDIYPECDALPPSYRFPHPHQSRNFTSEEMELFDKMLAIARRKNGGNINRSRVGGAENFPL